MEADYYNTCIQKINRKFENLCREMGVQFVNNDVNFKNLDGSIKDEYFSEDGETLADTRAKTSTEKPGTGFLH